MKEYLSTKNGKPIKPRPWWFGYGFRWIGRDDHGVSIWDGDWKALRPVTGLFHGIGGLAVGIGVLALVLGHVWQPITILAPIGAVLLGLGWWMKQLYVRFSDLATVEEVAERLGVDADELDDLAAGKEMRPRAVVNGKAVYDPADLGDVALLLRVASPPPDATLLRPAGSARTDHETLLHLADGLEDSPPLAPAVSSEDETVVSTRQQ